MRPTIRDVARKMNLSITTVSRALDGYADVSEETRQKVIKTARQMGYVPNRAARQLRRRKADTIGFILPAGAERFADPFYTEFIAGLGHELASHDFDLLVSAAANARTERDLYRRWTQGGKVDGFILNRMRADDWRARFLLAEQTPFVALEHSGRGRYPCIRVDGAEGYVELVRHIRQQGFTRPAFLGGPAGLVNQENRLGWFREAMKVEGLPLDEELICSADLTSAGGYEAALALLRLDEPPDAILCINDETAFGALHAAHKQGLEIGKQVAVAGFDGVQESRHTEPPLTSLDIPVYDVARRLVSMLLSSLAGEPMETPVFIKPELLIRASTGG